MDNRQRIARGAWVRNALLLLSAFGFGLLSAGKPANAQGKVHAWGGNYSGQLGDNTFTDRNSPVYTTFSAPPGFLSGVIALSGGYEHTIALKADGSVWTWGYNFYGQSGNGTITQEAPYSNPQPVQVKGPNGNGFLSGIVAVAGGYEHSIALKADGTVWTWGANFYGQLGNGTYSDSTTPVQVKGVNGNGFLSGVVAIAGGGGHTIVLKADGTVWTWGYNSSGQLGDGTFTLDTPYGKATPVQVKGLNGAGFLSGVVSIAGGGAHTIALRSDGSVWTWGDDFYGQLGDGTTLTNAPYGKSTPVKVKAPGGSAALSGISAIAGGGYHTIALKSGGTVWVWGYNGYGELGNGTTTDSNLPVQVKGANGVGVLSGVSAISGGVAHTIALKSDGTVRAWGYNSSGQLGDGTNTDSLTPVQTLEVAKALVIAADSASSFALEAAASVQGKITVAGVSRYTLPVTFAFRPANGVGDTLLRDTYLPFTGNVLFTDVPAGTYDVAIKGANTLQRVVHNVNTTGGVNFGNVTLLPGDATGDNSVNFDDFQRLADAYFTVAGDALYDVQADFNTNGEVNFDDFQLLADNYFTDGDD